MTIEYQQSTINLQGITPIEVTTVDPTAVIISLGALTEDGSSATVGITGGGSQSTDVSTNKYAIEANTTYTRTGGVINPGTAAIIPVTTGLGVTLAFLGNAVDDRILISIATTVFPYVHRLFATVTIF